MFNECKGAITLRGAAPELRARNVIAWRCECGACGEYSNAVTAPVAGVFRHEKLSRTATSLWSSQWSSLYTESGRRI